ncbi:MAG: hypothetical protein ATN34_04330 [Epulopiscium sp. Nele67-Bin002]
MDRWKQARDILIVVNIFVLLLAFVVSQNRDFYINLEALARYSDLITEGYRRTIWLSLVALVVSLTFSAVLFFMTISKYDALNYLYIAFTQIMLGVPLMVHIIVLYFFLTSAIGIRDPIIGGTLILSLYMSCYFAKTFEGAYNDISPQQFKMMHILQLPKSVCIKKIILPQMIKATLPTLTTHFALLVKSTALLSLISVPEFTQYINLFNSRTLDFVTGYVILAIGYLTITIPLSFFAYWLNRKVGD